MVLGSIVGTLFLESTVLDICTTVLTWLMRDQMSLHIRRDEKQHLRGRQVSTCCWRVCLYHGWAFQTGSDFRLKNFLGHKHHAFSWCSLYFPSLCSAFCDSTLLHCDWSILVILCVLPVALIYLEKMWFLGVVYFLYDENFDGVSSFYCCNTSPCDQQFKALQGDGSLVNSRLKPTC